MKKFKITVIHGILPLIMGGLIYFFFRSSSLKMFSWFKYIGIDSSVSTVRQDLSGIKYFLPQWTYFSLPDGLWVYSFTSALLIVWDNQLKNAKFWLLIPVVFEIAQGFKIFPGTFDILDLTITIVALLLSIIIINHKFKQNDKQKKVH